MEIGVFREEDQAEHIQIKDHEKGTLVCKTNKKYRWEKDEVPDDIDFDDEIESIEFIGEQYCVDIEVSDDHLFVANGVLTKNSKAIVDTCDFLAALIYPEELREKRLQIWKVLKNRFGGTVNYKMPVKTCHEKSKVMDVEDDDLGLETQQPISTTFNQPKSKPNKTEVNMKFNEENLDDDLWDDE